MDFKSIIFRSFNEVEFNSVAIEVFHFQYEKNEIYRQFVNSIKPDPLNLTNYHDIPFLPVSFFKTHNVVSGCSNHEKIFLSSGTTGMERSRHIVSDLSVYNESLIQGFETFYGHLNQFTICSLTPDPSQNPDSSLIYMIDKWICQSRSVHSGFYLDRQEKLAELLTDPESLGKNTILIGLTYALLDFAEQFPVNIPGVIIMETGGMKGRRKEIVRDELHACLGEKFGCSAIHSEYGMTEMLSQAYSKGNGVFNTPSWMKVLIRDTNDPLSLLHNGKTGGINIIDLANFNSCSFLALQDLGRINNDGTFEVLGRFDFSDLRGCNLMIDEYFKPAGRLPQQ
jgi:hypothetical protein